MCSRTSGYAVLFVYIRRRDTQANYGAECRFQTYSSVAIVSGDDVLLETQAVFVTAAACPQQ